jgi:hypothetical protein
VNGDGERAVFAIGKRRVRVRGGEKGRERVRDKDVFVNRGRERGGKTVVQRFKVQ